MKNFLILLLCIAASAIILTSCENQIENSESVISADTEIAEIVDHDLVNTDSQSAYKFMENYYNEPENNEGTTVKVSGIVKVINVDKKTYYYLTISDDENIIDIPFSIDTLDKSSYPENNDRCELTGTLKEITDDGIYGIYLNSNGIVNETAKYRDTVSYSETAVTLENSRVFSAYGVTLRYKGVESGYFNLLAKNESDSTAVIRSYNNKINGNSANFSIYEILEAGEEKEISACIPTEENADNISMAFTLEDDNNNVMLNTGEIVFSVQ